MKSRPKFDKRPLIRAGIILFVVSTFIGAICMSAVGIDRLFFSANPHFIVREIQILRTKGNLNDEDIKARLELNIDEQDYNIFALDLGELREKLIVDPIIEEAEVLRKLPDTLEVIVSGRTPVAQLLTRNGKTVDAKGYLMPYGRTETLRNLPIIRGIKNVKNASFGTRLNDPMLAKALEFLRHKAMSSSGNMIEISSICCNPRYNELNIILKENRKHSILRGARLDLPVNGMEHAFKRTIVALEARSYARQPSGHIKAIYDRLAISPHLP
ncbi:hypothetical protein BVY04_03155 [bacterium M21]|nr:hypothetical protein BVY04_03155 [bacterium M21]